MSVRDLTHEDQLLVTRAALAGVKFWRTEAKGYWTSSEFPNVDGMYTIGRAAMYALWKLDLVTEAEREEYLVRTHGSSIQALLRERA